MNESLEQERAAVIAESYQAFHGVTRGGGTSWSETELLDGGRGRPELLAEARKKDLDTRWEELVDDPIWNPWPGGGGFSFLDLIGFIYYLPAALVRIARLDEPSGLEESMGFQLSMRKHEPVPSASEWLDPAQNRAVARFLRFRLSLAEELGDEVLSVYRASEAYGEYWPTLLG